MIEIQEIEIRTISNLRIIIHKDNIDKYTVKEQSTYHFRNGILETRKTYIIYNELIIPSGKLIYRLEFQKFMDFVEQFEPRIKLIESDRS